MSAKKTGEPGWLFRRWLVFPTMAFSAWQLEMLRHTDSIEVVKLLVWTHGFTMVALVLFYTGFATIQDVIAIIKTGRGLPYKEDPQIVETKIEQIVTPADSESKIKGL